MDGNDGSFTNSSLMQQLRTSTQLRKSVQAAYTANTCQEFFKVCYVQLLFV
ncbi:hypothetical protein ACEQ8H_002377 [Pleosporales sp. CAS-2024a]